MVEKREAVGILLTGIIGIFIGLLKLYYDIFLIFWSLSKVRSYSTYIVYSMMIVFAILFLLSAIYIIKRRNWARALFMLLLALFIMGDISQYIFAHHAGSLSLFAELIVFIFSAFAKPFIPFLSHALNNFFGVFIYIYIVFTVFYLTRSGVKAQFE